MNTYYLSNPTIPVTTAASDLRLTSFPANLPAEDEAIIAKIGAASDYERALNFILNECTRELLGEWQRWETLISYRNFNQTCQSIQCRSSAKYYCQ